MRWAEIDLAAKTWTLPKERSRNAQVHTVPLSDAAIAILERLPHLEGGAGFVFTTTGTRPIAGWVRPKQRIDAALPPDMPPWVLHDLRRSFASGCARMGIAIHIVEACLNHRSGAIRGVAKIYNRYSYDAEKRTALEAWARYVQSIVSGKPDGNVVELSSARA